MLSLIDFNYTWIQWGLTLLIAALTYGAIVLMMRWATGVGEHRGRWWRRGT